MLCSVLFALLCTSVLQVTKADNQNDTSVKDGPCPSPAPVPNFDVEQVSGRWLLTHMTFDVPAGQPDSPPACVEEQFQLLGDGAFTVNSTFKRDGDSRIKKYAQDGDAPGKYVTYVPTATGWSDQVFHHSTFVAFEGDAFLDFCCRELENNQHREFHRIRSRNSPVPEDVLEKLVRVIRNSGDEKALYQYDQENCNYDQ